MTETTANRPGELATVEGELAETPQRPPTIKARAERVFEAGRARFEQVRELADDDRVQQRTGTLRIALGEVRDGLTASKSDPDEQFLRQFHIKGDLNLPVKPEMLAAYQKERDRIDAARRAEADRRAARSEWEAGLEFAQANAGTITGSGGLAVALADLVGMLPAPNALSLSAGVAGCVWCWLKTRTLRKQGREHRMLEDRRRGYLDPAVEGDSDHDGEVSADYLTTVFRDAGAIAGPTSSNPAGEQVYLAAPVQRDEYGWEATVRLPSSTTAAIVAAKRDRLAAAIDPHLVFQQVHVAVESIGVVRLRVYNVMPFTGAGVASPVVRERQADLSRPLPMALDINHQVVHLDIPAGRHVLIIAKSGNGKTKTWLNALLLALAADPNASGAAFDGKSEGGFDPYQDFLDWYIDRETDNWHEALASKLEAEVEVMKSRQQRIRKGEKLGERLLFLDEFHVAVGNAGAGATSKDTPTARIRACLDEFSRQGRSAKMRMVLASQSFNGNTMDADLLENFGIKIVGHCSREMCVAALGKSWVDQNKVDTSTMILDGDQAGTAVIVAPGVQGYVLARGWYQGDAVVHETLEDLPAKTPTATVPSPRDQQAEEESTVELPALLAALEAYLRELADDGDDRAVVPTGELADEANPEALTLRAYGDALAALGIAKVDQDPDTGKNLRRPSRAVADIRRAVMTARNRPQAS